MQDQPDIADHIVLCILLGTFLGLLFIGALLINMVRVLRKRYNAKMEERIKRNKQTFIRKANNHKIQ